MPNTPDPSERIALEHPDTTAIKEHEIAPLKARVDKCYSKENFQIFQEDVEKIVLKTIDGEGRSKVKGYAREATKEYNQESGWEKLRFWGPLVVSAVAIIVAYFKHS